MNEQEIRSLKEAQKQYFNEHRTIPVSFRKSQLNLLYDAIKLYENEILEALKEDLGKDAKEAYMAEIGMVYSEIRYMLKHLDCLADTRWTLSPLHQFPSVSYTCAVPYGNVLIISPWNYPFLLTMQPLVDALAAGNTAVVKPSNYSAHTSAVIQKLISNVFQPEYVACILGGRAENQMLLDIEFDYIFFTGSKAVGHLVMEKASRHLTPISLELGGKSPVIVDETANLALAAKRIVFGKFLNAGQTCVAPDYLYVHESVKEALIAQIQHQISLQYPSPASIGKIITEKHFQRLLGLIEPEKVVYGGSASVPTRQISPTVMDNVTWEDPVMQEEIFGPILPVLTYSDFNEVMNLIASKPTPLAFYLFTKDEVRKEYYKYVQPFGGGCINDTIIQLANDRLPFGGMGASGIGHYHGRYGFETFSHIKGITDKATWLDLPMRYANAGKWEEKLIRWFVK